MPTATLNAAGRKALEDELAAALADEAAAAAMLDGLVAATYTGTDTYTDPQAVQAVASAVKAAAARLRAARWALVHQWTPFACKAALKWLNRTARRGEVDDWCSVAVMALMDAVGLIDPDPDRPQTRRRKTGPNNGRYDPTKGFRFATYANHHLRKWLGEHAHAERCGLVRQPRDPARRPVDAPAVGSWPENDGDTWEPAAPEAVEPPPDETRVWTAVAEVVTDPRERRILWLRYKDGCTLDEIGREVGITKERVRQILIKSMDRLRAARVVFEGFLEGAT